LPVGFVEIGGNLGEKLDRRDAGGSGQPGFTQDIGANRLRH